ncbi:MAG: hypothetical protein ACI86X_002504 [Moritella sp.]|jgi:hypothetical protein
MKGLTQVLLNKLNPLLNGKLTMKKYLWLTPLLLLSACARMDHIQLGDIDQSQGVLKPISVKVSENTVSVGATLSVAQAMANNSSGQEDIESLKAIWALLNMGPRTGIPVFNDTYAQNVLNQLYAQCPSGKITAIRSIREANDYAIASGEIVRIDADCII